MTTSLKDAIRRHHDALVKGMTNVPNIMDHLFQDYVIEDDTMEEIGKVKNPPVQARMLLEVVEKQSDDCLPRLQKALRCTGHEDLADLLVTK